MKRNIHIGYFPWQIHFPSSHYSTIKHGFSYSTKHLPVRDFTIRGPLWSSSIFTSYQPWQNNNESYLHQTILGPLPKPLCYGAFFKGWHQWQLTLINTPGPKVEATSLRPKILVCYADNPNCDCWRQSHVGGLLLKNPSLWCHEQGFYKHILLPICLLWLVSNAAAH